MSYTPEQVGILAGTIYSGLSSPSSQSIGYVSGWLTDDSSIGDLNNRLATDFSISGGGILGNFGHSEASIYALIYKMEFYETQARQVLAAGGVLWTNIKEGDSSVTRANPIEVSKAYIQLHEKAQEDLHIAIANWTLGQTLPASVDSSSLPSWPTP